MEDQEPLMEDQESLIERPPEVNFQRRGFMTVLLALVAGASLALCSIASEPKLRQQAGDLPSEIVVKAEGGGIETEATGSGNQARHDVNAQKQTIIQTIYQVAPKNAPQISECTVVKATHDKITFHGSGDEGTFISYSVPKNFEGKFYIKHKPVTNVKDLPKCLAKLWLRDPGLGGDVSDLPKALTNLSLPGQPSENLPYWMQQKELQGDVRDLPPLLRYLDLEHTSQPITGNVRDLPRGLVHLHLPYASHFTGWLGGLPRNLRYANLTIPAVQGDTQQLPRSLTVANFFFATSIHGDVKYLPRGLTWAGFDQANITGLVDGLPRNLRYVALGAEVFGLASMAT